MAVSLRVSSSFTSGSPTVFTSCSASSDSICNKTLLLKFQPLQRRRLAGAVRAEQGESKGNQTDGASPAGFSLPTLPEWAKWAFAGSVWLSAVPVWKKLRDVGRLVVKVDQVVERVEDLAEKAEHIAEELAEDLPDGDLKKAVLQMEKASEEVISKAKVLDDILDKTDEVVRKLYYSTKVKDKEVVGPDQGKDVSAGME